MGKNSTQEKFKAPSGCCVVERAPPTLGLGVLEADGLPLGLQVPHGRHPVRGGPGQDLGGEEGGL